ncbi:hypothetical protein ACFWDA_24490 [Rhodococcus zopfii]|uniref:hypothetical protein n=1 Tax=Rhodococcus zopfii TaxID=43772 RepID=UPI003665B01B
MMSTETAHSAGDHSASISTASSGSVPVHVVRVVAEAQRSPVYNLTVEDVPEYFAGGVLVHNCDALRYAVATSNFQWRHSVPLPDNHRFDTEELAA